MKKIYKVLLLFIIFILPFFCIAENKNIEISKDDINITFQKIIVQNVETEISIFLKNNEKKDYYEGKVIPVKINKTHKTIIFKNGKAIIHHTFSTKENFLFTLDKFSYHKTINPIPIWLSILPPLLAIIIALIFKEVFTALFIGLLIGTSIIQFYQGYNILESVFYGLFAIVDTYILNSLTNGSHMIILLFSLFIGGMVNLIVQNGGMKGVVKIMLKYAYSPRSGQFITWLLGTAIFFDDYANTLVVGNTMRPITDKLKISREKLAYIVDSTAAPVASLALITTWIGIELSYIQDGINAIGINEGAYNVFIKSLNTRFYLIFTLAFVLIIIFKKKDFGPMLTAERKARKSLKISSDDAQNNQDNNLEISDNIKARWYNAVIPVLVLIFGTIVGLYVTGKETSVEGNGIWSIIGKADSLKALLWSSLLSILVAIFMTLVQRIISLESCINSLINGFKTMLPALMILVLAWSLALITEHLHTADFLSYCLLDTNISPYWLPTLTFILSALIAFSTGSSWGTMAILYPLMLPASWLVCEKFGFDYNANLAIFYNVVSSILAGSVFGDHCSPISDTTILSSLSSSCNHIEHVRTQLPYALTVGGVAIVFGTIPSAFGISSLILFPLALIVLYLIIHFFGKKVV